MDQLRTSRTARTLQAAALAALILAPAGFVLSHPMPARAAPNGLTCRVFFYYSDAKKTNQVGTWARCPGGAKTGRTTKWFNVETFTVSTPNPPNPPQPGDLPCEFLASGCGPFGH